MVKGQADSWRESYLDAGAVSGTHLVAGDTMACDVAVDVSKCDALWCCASSWSLGVASSGAGTGQAG